MKSKTALNIVLISGIALFLVACGPKSETNLVSSADSSSSILMDTVPESAPSLNEGIKDAAPGSTVLVTGRVAGVMEPISKDFAAFVLADEELVFCDEMGGEGHCPTPWDACCEDADKLKASRAFVQFVDEAGVPLSINLKDAVGLADNDTVYVRGKLSQDSTPENRIIVAESLAIKR